MTNPDTDGPELNGVPAVNRSYACIVPDDNPVLGALVSSFFNEPGMYFPVFVFPKILVPPSEEFGYEDEGYIARGVGLNDAIVINNAVVRLRSEKVVFAGLSDVQKAYLYAHLPHRMVIEIDAVA